MTRLIAGFAMLMLAATSAMAYQVTGPVIDVTDTKIVVEKDKEKWEIARDKDTKVTGELKKGSRVTVQYKMTATSIEAKDVKGKDQDKGKAKDKK
ncbi:MAG: hypothetical protein V4637_04170 [Pseudomonadota bacterium]